MRTQIQVVIDGEHFACMSHAFAAARARGFAGCSQSFGARLKRGCTTWAELMAPLEAGSRLGGQRAQITKAAHRAEEKALMAQLCAELDARKAALKEAA